MNQEIKNQLEEHQQKIIEQLEKGKDVQISFQKSKKKLHAKTMEVNKII